MSPICKAAVGLTLTVIALLAIGCAKSESGKDGDDAKAGSPATLTTTTAGASAPLATCNNAPAAQCTELFSFGLLGSDGEKTSCEANNGAYSIGGSCAANESLVGICAQQRTRILPHDKGGLHAKVYTYEVTFDRGTNRVQAQGFGKSACEQLSGTWTEVSSKAPPVAPPVRTPAPKTTVNGGRPTNMISMKPPVGS